MELIFFFSQLRARKLKRMEFPDDVEDFEDYYDKNKLLLQEAYTLFGVWYQPIYLWQPVPLFIIIKIIQLMNMDSVREADEPLDIGVCTQHNRVFECYCTQCYW